MPNTGQIEKIAEYLDIVNRNWGEIKNKGEERLLETLLQIENFSTGSFGNTLFTGVRGVSICTAVSELKNIDLGGCPIEDFFGVTDITGTRLKLKILGDGTEKFSNEEMTISGRYWRPLFNDLPAFRNRIRR